MKKKVITKYSNKDGIQTVYLYNGYRVAVLHTFANGVFKRQSYRAIILEKEPNGVAIGGVNATFSALLWAKVDTAINNILHNKIAAIYREFCAINRIK